MNWQTIAFIVIYGLVAVCFLGICLWVCKDDLKKENGLVYERLKSIEESIEGARDTADDTPILTDV